MNSGSQGSGRVGYGRGLRVSVGPIDWAHAECRFVASLGFGHPFGRIAQTLAERPLHMVYPKPSGTTKPSATRSGQRAPIVDTVWKGGIKKHWRR